MESYRSEQVEKMLVKSTPVEHLPYGVPVMKEYAKVLESEDVIYIPKHAAKYMIKDSHQANIEKGYALCHLMKADKTIHDFTFFPSFLLTTVAEFNEAGDIIGEAENEGSAYEFAMKCWDNYSTQAAEGETETDFLLRMLEGKAIKIVSYRLVPTQKVTSFLHDRSGETFCEVDNSPEKVFTLELIDQADIEG